MPCEVGGATAVSRDNRERVPAPVVSRGSAGHEIRDIAAASDPGVLPGAGEVGRKCLNTTGLLAWVQEHDVLRHRATQVVEIAGVDRLDSRRMQVPDRGCREAG